jgi:HSP20 family protein
MMPAKWEPWRELANMRDWMDRVLQEGFGRTVLPALRVDRDVPLDVYEQDSNLVVKALVPGLKPDDIEVKVSGSTLTISGQSREDREVKEKDYYLREMRYGAVSRSVQLPVAVQSDRAEAVFEDGVLTLTLPKAPGATGTKIPVKKGG